MHSSSSDGDQAVFVPITPCRLFDARADQHVGNRIAPIAASETFTQQVRGTNGNCTIPDDAVGVAMNVTAVNGSAASFLTIWPADAPTPLASSLNWVAGAPPTPNKVDVKLSANGAISLYNNTGTVDVLADVVGYYAAFDNPAVRMSVNPRTMDVVIGFTSDTANHNGEQLRQGLRGLVRPAVPELAHRCSAVERRHRLLRRIDLRGVQGVRRGAFPLGPRVYRSTLCRRQRGAARWGASPSSSIT